MYFSAGYYVDIAGRSVIGGVRCPPDSPKPDSPKPVSPNLEKVHSMSKCSCFVEKSYPVSSILHFSPNFSAIVILSSRNIPMQHYVLLILWHSRLRAFNERVFARFSRV